MSRQRKQAEQLLADLEAIASKQADRVDELEQAADINLAGLTMDQLEGGAAADIAKATVELDAARKVLAEMTRRVDAQRIETNKLIRADERVLGKQMASQAYKESEDVAKQLREVATGLQAIMDRNRSDDIRSRYPQYTPPFTDKVLSTIEHAIERYDKDADMRIVD